MYTFKMNDRVWEIEETDLATLREEYIKDTKLKEADDYYIYGLCCVSNQKILLNEAIHKDKKRTALLHELMHCYIECFVGSQDNMTFNEEGLCNLSANSHDIISEIADKYFNSRGQYTIIKSNDAPGEGGAIKW